VKSDPKLEMVASLGRRTALVRLARSAFALDRIFDGVPWGVGLLFAAHKRATSRRGS
jgi:hypothetical protein